MPNYDWKCRLCGATFERRESMDTPTTACPECQGTADKQPSAPGFALKGPGFHKNDYPTPGRR